ncbi:DHA2 family metal-tetracycline-proton antiporter-like MFS transporter [Bacillus mesophilus]|uniref:MFS transporter n=1 Tax=Bacillus mesophilus TaxID=1808955 RepID=A0A6M0Q8Q9_9BACI|nr:MFS transporter [Bacillus mesophilus]MBM7661978.1 DHA2 family metal-tetracycline-proton antiporter-like MFS transporter [Bacillus mesophilus]NEY72663.1 MFS transporter [Bacillus mesophilus]
MSSISISAPGHDQSEVLQENKVILLWSFTVWLVVMNTTMFNVALPSVLADLTLTSSTASWIVSGYSIVFAISTLTYSRLSDFIPISKLLIIGLSVLGAASIIGFFSQHFFILLLARVLQAAGAGAVPGLAMVLAGRYIPVSRRGKAMAYIASAASLGFGLGPVLGGAITQYLGWNYLFAVTGIVILLIPIFLKLLPNEPVKPVKFDTLGGLLTGLGVTALLLFLTTFSLPILFGCISILVLMWWRINTVEVPFVQPSLFKNRQFSKLLFIGFIAFVTHFAILFLMPIILTEIFSRNPAEVGLIIFPGAILSAIAAQFIGRFIDHFGNAPVIFFGQVCLLISTILFAWLTAASPYSILFIYMFTSIGFSALTSSISNEVTRILSYEEIGAGMGMIQLIQFFGGAFGVTLTGIALTLQNGFTAKVTYFNIYGGLTVLLLTSALTFGHYYLKTKKV